MTTILIVLLVLLLLGGGGYGVRHDWGAYEFGGVLTLVLAVLLILWAAGVLRGGGPFVIR